MISGKDIIIDAPTPPTANTLPSDAPDAQVDAIFQSLRDFMDSQPAHLTKNDRVAVLISACIDAGVDTGRRITGVVHHFKFNRRHAGMILRAHLGIRWAHDATGRYRNLI